MTHQLLVELLIEVRCTQTPQKACTPSFAIAKLQTRPTLRVNDSSNSSPPRSFTHNDAVCHGSGSHHNPRPRHEKSATVSTTHSVPTPSDAATQRSLRSFQSQNVTLPTLCTTATGNAGRQQAVCWFVRLKCSEHANMMIRHCG